MLAFVACVGLVASTWAVPAQAQPAQLDPREVNARQLFAVGKYAEALEIFSKLYADTGHPTYLRNVGRCYQNLGDPDRAIASFREYLRQARDLPDDQRKLIEGYIDEMEALKRKRASEAAPAPPAAPTVVSEGAPTMVLAPPAPAPEEDRSRTAAYVVGGASLVALGAGAVFGVLAISNDHAADKDCTVLGCPPGAHERNENAVRDARICDVLVGAGLVGAGIATYLYLTSRPSSAPERTAARRVRPTLGAGLAGLGLEGSW